VPPGVPAEPAAALGDVPAVPPFELPLDPPPTPVAPPDAKPASLELQPTAPTAKDKLPITNTKRIISDLLVKSQRSLSRFAKFAIVATMPEAERRALHQ